MNSGTSDTIYITMYNTSLHISMLTLLMHKFVYDPSFVTIYIYYLGMLKRV